jgi:PAS domain S-box-containing protein
MCRIMVVDDETATRLGTCEAISSLGYEVVGRTASGREAVDKAVGLAPDLILMDIVMPGEMDGIEAAYEIKKVLDVPIIFLTAYYDDPLLDRVRDLKPAGYLLKPFHAGGLRAAIETVLSNQEMERRLVESERKYRAVVENGNEGIAIIQDGAYRFVNKKLCDMTGYSREELIDTPFAALIGPEYQKPVSDAHQRRLNGHEAPDTLTFTLMDKDGRERWIDGRDALVTWEGRPATLTLLGDITERKQMEERLKRYAGEMEKMSEEALAFSYIISHDLKAPLINIKGFAGEMKDNLAAVRRAVEPAIAHLTERQKKEIHDKVEVEAAENLDFILSSFSRIEGMVNSIIRLSRLGGKELDFEDVDVDDLVADSLKTLAHQIGREKIQVTVGTLPSAWADIESMETIIGNLITNAVKFLDPARPGKIEIWGQENGTETAFYVRDNGRGIAAEDLQKVFRVFYRSGRRDVPGEGMGLAYAKTLVARHGGSVRCESEPGVGTTFVVTIPKRAENGSGAGDRPHPGLGGTVAQTAKP